MVKPQVTDATPGAAAPAATCSSIEATMGVLGRAWAGAVLQAMLDGAERYTDIRRAVAGVSDAVLSARLRELCEHGFARRDVDPGPPTAITYQLTEVGRDTKPVLEALQEFGRRHRDSLL